MENKKIILIPLFLIFLIPIVQGQVTSEDVILHYSMDNLIVDNRVYNSKGFNIQPHLDFSPLSMLSPSTMGAYGSNRALMLNNASYNAVTNRGLQESGVNHNEYMIRIHVNGYDGFGNDIGNFFDMYHYDSSNPTVKNINRIRIRDQSGFPSGGVVEITNSTGHLIYTSFEDFVINIPEGGRTLFVYISEYELRVYEETTLKGSASISGMGLDLFGSNHKIEIFGKTVPVNSRIDEITVFNRYLTETEKLSVMNPEEDWLLEEYNILLKSVVPFGEPLLIGDTLSNRQIATFQYNFINPVIGTYTLRFDGDINVYSEDLTTPITSKTLQVTGTQSGEFDIGVGVPLGDYPLGGAYLFIDLENPDGFVVLEKVQFFDVNTTPDPPPDFKQISTLPIINMDYNLTRQLSLDNYFEGQHNSTLTFFDEFANQTIEIKTESVMGGGDEYIIMNGSENIVRIYSVNWLETAYNWNTMHYYFQSYQTDYFNTMQLEVCSEELNECITRDLLLNIGEGVFFEPAPSFINNIPDITIDRFQSYTLDFKNFVRDYTSMFVRYNIGGVQYILNAGNTRQHADFDIALSSTFVMTITGKNRNSVTNMTVVAQNQQGSSSQNFILTTLSDDVAVIPPDVPDWFPSPPDGQKPFYAIIIIFIIGAFVSLSTPTESWLAKASFGTVTVIGMFLLFSYIGWIPMWITVMLLIITVLIIAGLVGRVIIGGR